jgi:DNA adenine methylase
MITLDTVPFRPPTVDPVLKWAGGKRWLFPIVAEYWKGHEHRRYVEPFAGGMAIGLGLQPKRALVADVNPHLINFYQWVQYGTSNDGRLVGMVNAESTYYAHRARFNKRIQLQSHESEESAWLFYYLNKTCFNGLCRFNASGAFNTPFGKYKKIRYLTEFPALATTIANWKILRSDFESIPIAADDFVYLDPPYDVPFTTYSSGGFKWDDQVRVARWAANHPGPVLLSNQATPRILDLYAGLGFEIQLLKAPRRISCTGDRQPTMEVLARRNLSS